MERRAGRGQMSGDGEAQEPEQFNAFFDPEQSPLLKAGYLSPEWRASPSELEAARAKLAVRARRWLPLGDSQRAQALASLSRLSEEPGSTHRFAVTARELLDRGGPAAFKPLPFYQDGFLLHVEEREDGAQESLTMRLVVVPGRPTYLMTAEADVIQRMNREIPLKLSRANVEDYLAFFLEHVHGDEGGFYVIEEDSGDERSFPDRLNAFNRDERVGRPIRDKIPGLNAFETFPRAEVPMPITLLPVSKDHAWTLLATLVYAGQAFRAAFELLDDGAVAMLADGPLEGCALRPMQTRWIPKRTPKEDR
jgi:hypothetical protein